MDWNRERTSGCCSTQEAARHFWEKYNAPMAVQSDDETWYVVEREFLDTLGMLAMHGISKEGGSSMGVALKDLPLQIRNRQLLSPACRNLARPTKLSLLDDSVVFAQGERFELVNEEFWRLLAKHFRHDVEVPRRVYRDGYRRRVETQPLVLSVYSATPCPAAAAPAASMAADPARAGALLHEGAPHGGAAAAAGAGAAGDTLLRDMAAGGSAETCCPRLVPESSRPPAAGASAAVRGREGKSALAYSPIGEIILSRGDTLADLRHQVLQLLRNVLQSSNVSEVEIFRGTLSSRNDVCSLEPLEPTTDAAAGGPVADRYGSSLPGLLNSAGKTSLVAASSSNSSTTKASQRHSCGSRTSAGNSSCFQCGEEVSRAGAVAVDRNCSCGGAQHASGRRGSGSSDGAGSNTSTSDRGGSSSASNRSVSSKQIGGSRTTSSGSSGMAAAEAPARAAEGEAGKTLAEAGFDQDIILVVADRGLLADHVAGSRAGRGAKKSGGPDLAEQQEKGDGDAQEADVEEEDGGQQQSPLRLHTGAALSDDAVVAASPSAAAPSEAVAAGAGVAWGLRGRLQQQQEQQQQVRGGRERRGGGKIFEEEEEQDADEGEVDEEDAREIFKRGGLCGLINVGNTCFLNSAVQCLSKVMPLSYYFLSNKYLADLNEQNVMGTQGRLARAYCNTLREMWFGEDSPLAPRELKWAVGRVREEFLGYNQQDSQELIAFLLDGLHEDLNRVKKKPYYESKIEGGPDKADAEVAELCWQRHKEINDSFIVDCFQGLYRSRLQCPQCKKISKTFDPFMYLSLPVPPDCGTVTFALACDPLLPSGFAFDRAAPAPLDYATAKQVYLEIVDRLFSADADQPLTAEEKELLLRHILSSTWLQDIQQLSTANVLMVTKGLGDSALSVYNSDASLRIFRCGDTLKPRFDRHNAYIFAWLLPAAVVQELEGRSNSVFRGEQSLASSGTFFALVLPTNKASRPPTIEKGLPSRWQMPLLLPVAESTSTCEEFYSRVEQAYLYDYSAEEEACPAAASSRERTAGFDGATAGAATTTGFSGGGDAAACAAENAAGDSSMATAASGEGGAAAGAAGGSRIGGNSSSSGTRFVPLQQQQQQQQRSLLNHAVGLFRSISGHHAASSADDAAATSSRLILLSAPCSQEDLQTSRGAGGGGTAASGMLSQSMSLLTNGISSSRAAATQPRPLPDDGQLLASFLKPNAGEFLTVVYADLSALTDNSEKYGELESVSHMGALVAPPSVDISDCLRLFSEQERLDENNTWYCSSCKQRVQAFKKLDLWKIPRTLILHLKRFHNISRWNRAKIGTKVTFPFKTGDYLDMKPYILPESLAIMRAQNPSFEPLYELVSVNVHSGDLGGGHYYAYVKLRGRWYECNDSWIQAVHEHACSSSDAYMLFYRLKQDEPHWIGAF